VPGSADDARHDPLEQAETNSWHIDKHTLRLLVTLGDLIDGMPECAKTFQVPTLVLHGDKDFFSSTDDVKSFFGNIPDKKTKGVQALPGFLPLADVRQPQGAGHQRRGELDRQAFEKEESKLGSHEVTALHRLKRLVPLRFIDSPLRPPGWVFRRL